VFVPVGSRDLRNGTLWGMTNPEQTWVLITGTNNGPSSDRLVLTVTEGTDSIVKLALIGAEGPTGSFIEHLCL
jgi:hypothetical protein